MRQGHLELKQILTLLALVWVALGAAQTDGTLGPTRGFSGHFTIPADVGQQRGGNLFHSFGTFDVEKGELATFSGPGSVRDVIVRVTGGRVSAINGTVACTIPGADLYLINPAGFAFGPSGALDVRGSFAASTGRAIILGAGGAFVVGGGAGVPLSAAPPEGFAFGVGGIGRITVAGRNEISADGNVATNTQLGVPAGRRIALAAASVDVRSATLQARGGMIDLLATGRAGGTYTLGDDRTPPHFSAGADGAISVRSDAIVSATGRPGGRVDALGGDFSLAGLSSLSADARPSRDGSASLRGTHGTGVTLDLRGTVSVADQSVITSDSYVTADAFIASSAGGVRIDARDVMVSGFSQVRSTVQAGGGSAAGVAINASGRLSLANADVTSDSGDGGAAGIAIRAGSTTLKGSSISASALGTAEGGEVSVATRRLTLSADSLIASGAFDSLADGGPGGAIRLRVAGPLLVSDSAISASTDGPGRGGDVMVQAGRVTLRGSSAAVASTTGIEAETLKEPTRGTGAAGNVMLTVSGDLSAHFAEISTRSAREGGSLSIRAGGRVDLYRAQVSAAAVGNGGQVTIASPLLITLDRRSAIGTQAGANGGNIAIDPLAITLSRGSGISANGGKNGGNISLSADQTRGAVFGGPGANVTATGATGVSGSVGTGPANTDVTNAIPRLPVGLLGADVHLQPQCGESGAFSSFLVSGHGGLSLEPGRWQWDGPAAVAP